MRTISIQPELCRPLSNFRLPKAVLEQEQKLRELDELIKKNRLDLEFLALCQSEPSLQSHSPKTMLLHFKLVLLQRFYPHSVRGMELLVSRNEAMHQFLGISRLDDSSVRPPSKTKINNSVNMFPAELIESFNQRITELALECQLADVSVCEQEAPFIEVWTDTTAIEPHAHYPVDWILLADAVRSFARKIRTIRKSGLAYLRIMSAAKKWQSRMNHLSIAFHSIRRKKASEQKEKEVKNCFRQILNLARLAKQGMLKVRDHLDEHRATTRWSEGRIQRVLGDVDKLLSNLQNADEQAVGRILKGEQMPSDEKLLSLYEEDMQVISRAKSGKSIEYGNTLRVSENQDGLIVDWHYYQEKAPNDSKQLPEVLESVTRNYGPVAAICADRQFDSPENRKMLAERNIINAVCPRSVPAMKEALKDKDIRSRLKRRASTEALIATIKNVYLKGKIRAKGFASQHRLIGQAIMAHNLKKLLSFTLSKRSQIPKPRAA